MYEYIKGELVELTPEIAIVDHRGLGFKLHIPLSTYTSLLRESQDIILYVSPVYREDSQKLYGFTTKSQRDLFDRVCDVSGIGPKIALSLIGHLNETELALTIENQDVKTLSSVPGLGKKTAERLIVEMKDRVKKLALQANSQDQTYSSLLTEDALLALTNLGYQKPKAQKAIEKALKEGEKDQALPELITSALKFI